MAKILLIEDEELMINLLKKKLSQEGYEVLVAKDGSEGLKLMKEIKPDLILLDIEMPKIGGLAVMEEIAKDQALSNIPILVISNSGQPIELDKARGLGAKDCLIKTEFHPQEVVEKIKKQIG
jgi:two-component system alkaline phosphatase synthesis response regulator PhoP